MRRLASAFGGALLLLACGPGEPEPAGDRPAPAAAARDTPPAPPPAAEPPPSTPPAPPAPADPAATESLPSERAPEAAYRACQDSVAATLPDPAAALWGEVPDNVKPTGEPGRWAVLAQVRPDSVAAGVTYACVVEESAGVWRVLSVETQPSSAEGPP